MRHLLPTALVLATALLASCGKGGATGGFTVVSDPPRNQTHHDQIFYELRVAGAPGAASFALEEGPPGMTVDGSGLVHWAPTWNDIGTHEVAIRVSAGQAELLHAWTLRISQGIRMGINVSPRSHSASAPNSGWAEHFADHAPYGNLVGFTSNWRDAFEADGELPSEITQARAASALYGFRPLCTLSWHDEHGVADLTSESEPSNNSWTNAETRAEFLAVAQSIASTMRPLYLALGHETNHYWRTCTPAEWDAWLSQLAECYAAIKAVSPDTRVLTVFQLERMKGLGLNAGWSDAPHFGLLGQHVPGVHVDLVGFTTLPYLEFSTPSALPLAYYDEIAFNWSEEVVFTEVAWKSAADGTLPGSEPEQAEFVDVFFSRTRSVFCEVANWLYLRDDPSSEPMRRRVGLQSGDGSVSRLAEQAWRDAVLLRQR